MIFKNIFNIFWRTPMTWVIYIYSLTVILIGVFHNNYDSLWFYLILVMFCNVRVMIASGFNSIAKIQLGLNDILCSLQRKGGEK